MLCHGGRNGKAWPARHEAAHRDYRQQPQQASRDGVTSDEALQPAESRSILSGTCSINGNLPEERRWLDGAIGLLHDRTRVDEREPSFTQCGDPLLHAGHDVCEAVGFGKCGSDPIRRVGERGFSFAQCGDPLLHAGHDVCEAVGVGKRRERSDPPCG